MSGLESRVEQLEQQAMPARGFRIFDAEDGVYIERGSGETHSAAQLDAIARDGWMCIVIVRGEP